MTDTSREAILALVRQYAEARLAQAEFIPGQTAVPPSGKVVGAAEVANMVDAALDAWLTTGRFNASFETRLGEFIGLPHVLTVNSGSSANLVAFTALTSPKLGERAIKPGDEVITVAAGFPPRSIPSSRTARCRCSSTCSYRPTISTPICWRPRCRRAPRPS